ncbi:hypothetical protein PHMEG_00024816 [Phytophthora megakarya]|uniref:SWIM-type domain-containing protein n=1 Tax=Phytophthora megakarya TaxID=4795 RepID=A0A225VEA0_9STRA|nr:hypothetical protein PHMEG_00024816 [Phytophthora megakarya]
MAEEARREEEVKAAEEDRMQRVRSAQTRSQKAQAIAKILDKREADDEDSRESADDEERGRTTKRGKLKKTKGKLERMKETPATKQRLLHQPSLAKKLSISDVGDESEEDEEEAKVLVPAFEAGQATWDSFEADLKRYTDATKQTLVVSENINVNRRNNTLRSQAQYQGHEDEDIPLVPTKFKLYQRKYIYTHEWQERERGGGTRTLRNTEYSEEMNIVIGMTTRWLAEAIETQYKVASNLDISAGYSFKDTGDHVIICNGNHDNQLQKDTLQYNCEFSQTMKLPCRHAMIYKRSTGSAFIVPFSFIEPR